MARRHDWIDEETIRKQNLWVVEFSPFAIHSLRVLGWRSAGLLLGYIERQLHAMPSPYGVGRRMGSLSDNMWRYEVGNYRMVAQHDHKRRVITIVFIEQRGRRLMDEKDDDDLG